jgi:hypothetical protein
MKNARDFPSATLCSDLYRKKDSSLGQSNSYSGMLVRWYIVFLVTLLIILRGWVFALKAMRVQPVVIDITNFPVLITTIEPHLAT